MLPGSRRALRVLLTAAAALLPALAAAPAAAARPTAAPTAACPAAGYVSQHHHSGHNGVDIAAPIGTPIHAIGDGEVTHSGFADGYGQWIRVQHPDGRISEYGHMYQRDVAVGEHVVAGQQIALMGQEGNSSGPHLHLRIWGTPPPRTGSTPRCTSPSAAWSSPAPPAPAPGPPR